MLSLIAVRRLMNASALRIIESRCLRKLRGVNGAPVRLSKFSLNEASDCARPPPRKWNRAKCPSKRSISEMHCATRPASASEDWVRG